VPRVAPGLSQERVGFFTDAVFAIAMTLLVIEIPRPEDDAEFSVGHGVDKVEASRHLLVFLYHQTSSFIAYLLAFWMLWIVWRQHHRLFDRIEGLSPRMLGWHFPLLLLIGFLPYATTVFGHHNDNPAAALLFALTVGGLLVSRSAVQSLALRDGLLREDMDTERFRGDARTSWVVAIYFLAVTPLVWWTPWVEFAWFGANLVGTLAHRRMQRS
jgi:uncharacterized membrane protein